MPSKSPKQARMMAGAAHNPAFAKKVGVPQSVAQDFNQADKGTPMLSQAMAQKHAKRTAKNASRYSGGSST
jgi:hypothetical protein